MGDEDWRERKKWEDGREMRGGGGVEKGVLE